MSISRPSTNRRRIDSFTVPMSSPSAASPTLFFQLQNSSFSYLHKTYNCTADNAVDPDVAGIGVMISFLVSAAIVFFCIIVGWFQNAIPGLREHPVDFLVKDTVCRCILRRKYNNTPASERLQEAFESFMLAFSDQQLVTGLALLISAYFKGDITVYSFQVASALAWFSSTIHLATLVVLKRYLREHKTVRNCRIALMLPIAGLLLASTIQSSDISIFYAPWHAVHCVVSESAVVDILSVSSVTFWLVSAFTNRIMNVYLNEQEHSRSWLFGKIMDGIDPLPPGQSRPSNLDILRTCHIIQQPQKEFGAAFKMHKVIFEFALREFNSSFAWEIVWLIFSFSYGLTNTILAWEFCSEPSDELGSCWSSILQMGFGQMVPLVLLLLPFLALLESFTSQAANNTASNTTNNMASGLTVNPTLPKKQPHGQLYHDVEFISGGGDPYETRSVRSLVGVVSLYCFFLLSAAGIIFAVSSSLAGFIVMFVFIMFTYGVGLSYEYRTVVNSLHRYLKK